jgi:hypothetical protein
MKIKTDRLAAFLLLVASFAFPLGLGQPLDPSAFSLAHQSENTFPSKSESDIPVANGLSQPAEPAALPEGASAGWWTSAQEHIRQSEYQIHWQDQTGLPDLPAAYQAPNRAHNLRTYFTSDGIRVIPRVFENTPSWTWGLTLTSYGTTEHLESVAPAELVVSNNRIEYRREQLTEWYLNDERGLEQGFTVQSPPFSRASSSLVLEFTITGNLSPVLSEDSQAIEFTSPNGVRVLRYADLYANDATGRNLPAYFTANPRQPVIRLFVDTSDAVYPITIDPIATSASWIAESNQEGAEFGISVSTAGDVNGDGYDDVIIGAHSYDRGQPNEGAAFVYYGMAAGLSFVPNWTGESEQDNTYFGHSVNTAGDVNGDGYADVIIGAVYYDNGHLDEGAAFIWYGSISGLGTNGTPGNADWMAESNQSNAWFGIKLGPAGDINNDGYNDVLISALYYDNDQVDEGRIYLYTGSAAGLSLTANWITESNQQDARFGSWVGTAGDVNGDGYADVIIGAYYYDNGQTNEGAAFVWYGSAVGLGPNGTPGNADWTAESNQTESDFGSVATTAGDINGDGYADIVIGASNYSNGQADEGSAFIYYGSASGLGSNGTPNNANWMSEGDQAGAYFGYSVSTAGDVNGDGYADMIIGAREYDSGLTDEGKAFVYHGSTTGLSLIPNWTTESNQAGAWLGAAASTAGDVNGDGYADVIIGAPLYDNGQIDEGRAYLYYGSASGLSAPGGFVYLPFLRSNIGLGIHGVVTLNGRPVAGVSLSLRFYNGTSWSTRAITITNQEGIYSFTNIPALFPGQLYYVRYINPSTFGDGRLGFWATREISFYAARSDVNIGNFDIADITLLNPEPGAVISLPITFQWARRPATPSDSYEFNLFDPYNELPYFYTPPLGYVETYTLGRLPIGFSPGVVYGWALGVYSLDGGYGTSFYYHPVMFSNTGFDLYRFNSTKQLRTPWQLLEEAHRE